MAGPIRKPTRPTLGLSRQSSPLLLERRVAALEQQAYDMAKGMEDLIAEVNHELDALQAQQAECNLRLLFVMHHFKFRKTVESVLVGVPPVVSEQTLYDIYMDQREAFEAKIQERVNAERQAAQDAADAAARDREQGILRPDAPLAPADEPKPADPPASGPKLVH